MTKQITNIAQFKPLPKSRGKIGMYLWSNSNELASSANGTSCPLSIDIFAEPCTIVGDAFNCNSTGGSTIDAGQTDLANLAVGDEFTTSDYTVVVTEASKTGTTFTGKGKLIFNFLKISNTLALQIPISVTFTGIKINQCYQLYNGSVITEYDESWGSVVSADQIKNQLSGVYTQIKDLLLDPTANIVALQNKIKDLRAARADLANADFTAEYKAEQLAALDAAISGMVCLVGEPPASGSRLSAVLNSNNCDVTGVGAIIDAAKDKISNPIANAEVNSEGLRQKYVDAINNGNISYSCNCGWIDHTHAFTPSLRENVSVASIWNQLLTEKGEKHPFYNGFKVTYKQDAMVKGGIMIGISESYFVSYNLDLKTKKQIALAILQDVSKKFETLQIGGFLLGDGSSSFEVADLVSNVLGYYSLIEKIDKTAILNKCGNLNPSESLAIYKAYPTIWDQYNLSYRNTGFSPIFFNTNKCINPVFPFNYITPMDYTYNKFQKWQLFPNN
jgi:hypothetical protein